MTFYMWEKKGVTVLWMTKDPTGNKIFDAQRWFLYYWMIGCTTVDLAILDQVTTYH